MKYFSNEFLKFFKNLSENNNTEWFHSNKKTYEKEVKDPFVGYVQEMINRVSKYEKNLLLKPKDAIFRINKDIRFSKDKSPYKTHVSAHISPNGKKDQTYPGLYFQLNHEGIAIYGGVYNAEKNDLHRLREYILEYPKELEKALKDKKFKEFFGEIQGEKNKVLPAEFKEAAQNLPLLYNKQFYYGANLPADLITSEKLANTLEEYYVAQLPVQNYFRNALVADGARV